MSVFLLLLLLWFCDCDSKLTMCQATTTTRSISCCLVLRYKDTLQGWSTFRMHAPPWVFRWISSTSISARMSRRRSWIWVLVRLRARKLNRGRLNKTKETLVYVARIDILKASPRIMRLSLVLKSVEFLESVKLDPTVVGQCCSYIRNVTFLPFATT